MEAQQDWLALERYENFHFSQHYIYSYVSFYGSTCLTKVILLEKLGIYFAFRVYPFKIAYYNATHCSS